MNEYLSEILTRISEDYKNNTQSDSRYYIEVRLSQKATELGFADDDERYRNACAIIPLKQPVGGMKVRIDGRTFVNYAQFESGIVVSNYVAREVDLPHKPYIAKDSMICNFA